MTKTSEEKIFRFGAEITKAEKTEDGDWIFDGIASTSDPDLQGESIDPKGLEIDYLLGKGLPKAAGGFINYDHDPTTIVGVPLDGKITPQGFWIRWKALKTPLMTKIVDQMKALKDAGWPRRYGMSIEGVVKEYDKTDPSKIKRAFIRNVALTPTPVNPYTYVDFAKSLMAGTQIAFHGDDVRRQAIAQWASDVASIRVGNLPITDRNPYFEKGGMFRVDKDVAYFHDVHGLPEYHALWCARYALSRQPLIKKSIDERMARLQKSGDMGMEDPHEAIRRHLVQYKKDNQHCPHLTDEGRFTGPLKWAARHFYACERRRDPEVHVILELIKDGDFFEIGG